MLSLIGSERRRLRFGCRVFMPTRRSYCASPFTVACRRCLLPARCFTITVSFGGGTHLTSANRVDLDPYFGWLCLLPNVPARERYDRREGRHVCFTPDVEAALENVCFRAQSWRPSAPKAQAVAPTLAALLVNLDQEDRLVPQAREVRVLLCRHVRPGRL
jgi:hypothetical protein